MNLTNMMLQKRSETQNDMNHSVYVNFKNRQNESLVVNVRLARKVTVAAGKSRGQVSGGMGGHSGP